jgi:hypothetical protein
MVALHNTGAAKTSYLSLQDTAYLTREITAPYGKIQPSRTQRLIG